MVGYPICPTITIEGCTGTGAHWEGLLLRGVKIHLLGVRKLVVGWALGVLGDLSGVRKLAVGWPLGVLGDLSGARNW